jgi:hypothetical protein
MYQNRTRREEKEQNRTRSEEKDQNRTRREGWVRTRVGEVK